MGVTRNTLQRTNAARINSPGRRRSNHAPPVAYIANAVIKAFKAGDTAEAGRCSVNLAYFLPVGWVMDYAALKASMEIIGLSLGKPYLHLRPLRGQTLSYENLFKNNLPFRRDPSERDPKACLLALNRPMIIVVQ